jgi:hypothetical protein
MKITEAFPSKYLSAPDLHNRDVKVVIARIEMEKIGRENDEKPVLYFTKSKKGLVLNKTNGKTIAAAYGDDTDQWEDREIILFSMMVQFGDEMVDSIRVKIPKPAPAAKPVQQTHSEVDPPPLDDDIPF